MLTVVLHKVEVTKNLIAYQQKIYEPFYTLLYMTLIKQNKSNFTILLRTIVKDPNPSTNQAKPIKDQ